MFRRPSSPPPTDDQRVVLDVENVITRLDAAIDRLDGVYTLLLPVVNKLQLGQRDDIGRNLGASH